MTQSSWQNSVYYHPGTCTDGSFCFGSDYYWLRPIELVGDNGVTHAGGSHWPKTPMKNKDGREIGGISGYSDPYYGNKGTLLKTPRFIRVLWDVGWNLYEHYPMVVFPFGGKYHKDWESIYMPLAGAGNWEQCIDYYDEFGTAINSFAQANNMGVCHLNQPLYEGYTPTRVYGGPAGGLAITSGGNRPDTNYMPVIHPGRWLFGLAPRYWQPFNIDPTINDTFSQANEKYIVGGEVLSIVFVTDAFSAYHGVSISLFTVPGQPVQPNIEAGSRPMMMEDIETIKRRAEKFKKFGIIIVNSPKNPEFGHMWVNGSPLNTIWINQYNNGRSYCLYDAQKHFQEVVGLLSGSIFCKLLMRPVTLTQTNPDETRHRNISNYLVFNGPQITAAEIMTEVRNFWSSSGGGGMSQG